MRYVVIFVATLSVTSCANIDPSEACKSRVLSNLAKVNTEVIENRMSSDWRRNAQEIKIAFQSVDTTNCRPGTLKGIEQVLSGAANLKKSADDSETIVDKMSRAINPEGLSNDEMRRAFDEIREGVLIIRSS
ncbi:hypothetical protein [uncultured Sphingomonas sp.]|uniref:hypothetical protein n=1 Tax=uncultured Sphingomonas sp. TaxID=158754 RepID=UPI0035CBB07B